MKQSLKQQFEIAHELEHNDNYVDYLYSSKSDKLIAAMDKKYGRVIGE
ncbi:hypothetical protein OYT88_02260 [Sporolactobacillus sp. CQH2019]|nr:hypothetical protein [Sporolactobacillus sp. CQH2019]MDD9147373.1 hypothetical protein [Sporolactobacillus sp. CQH2019]